MRLNLARTVSRSAANGPGERFVVWTQGCPLACPGCWNPDTWSFAKRVGYDTREIAEQILSTPGIEGVTFTGGEPFAQAAALAEVATVIRAAGLSVFVFTGYDIDELSSPSQRALMEQADVVVAGRYDETQRDLQLVWRSSRNQEVHFLTQRYGTSDMAEAPEVEVHIGRDGALTFTGFPPDGLRSEPSGE